MTLGYRKILDVGMGSGNIEFASRNGGRFRIIRNM